MCTCCSVLQCVAVCCNVLQCVAVCCSVLQCVAGVCSVVWRSKHDDVCEISTIVTLCSKSSCKLKDVFCSKLSGKLKDVCCNDNR